MATYRAASINHILFSAPEHCILPDADLIAISMQEARKTGAIGTDGGWASEEDFRAALNIGDWTDHTLNGLDIEDVIVTGDNIAHIRALVPADIANEVEVGETVSIHTDSHATYPFVIAFQPADRAVVQDQEGSITWADIEHDDYARLDVDDADGLSIVVDIDTGADVSAEFSQIDIEIPEESIRDQEGCDTAEAVAAVVKGVIDMLHSLYPHAQIDVETSRDSLGMTTVEAFSGDDVMDDDDRVREVEDVVRRAIERTISDGAWADAVAA